MGAEIVPSVPKMYSAKDPPKHVSTRIFLYCNLVLSDTNSSINFVVAGCRCIYKYAANAGHHMFAASAAISVPEADLSSFL
jgi:hypothetical protein